MFYSLATPRLYTFLVRWLMARKHDLDNERLYGVHVIGGKSALISRRQLWRKLQLFPMRCDIDHTPRTIGLLGPLTVLNLSRGRIYPVDPR
jgi:hypothetical protein